MFGGWFTAVLVLDSSRDLPHDRIGRLMGLQQRSWLGLEHKPGVRCSRAAIP